MASGPRGLALVDDGRTLVVSSGYEVLPDNVSTALTVIDVARLESGGDAVRGTIPTPGTMLGMAVSADGHTLYVTNRARIAFR